MKLEDRWVHLAGAEARHIGTNLVARYGEPHRRYHNREHLTEVLDRIDELAGYADAPNVVRLAAWFHDAVHDPQRGDNEERSAWLAERMLADTDVAPHVVAEVARLVRLTVTHAPEPEDHNGQVLCDADLAILAAEPERYARYAAAIREEYSFIPEESYRQGRAELLRGLLARPWLFGTPPARERLEEMARNNIETELMLLSAPPPQ